MRVTGATSTRRGLSYGYGVGAWRSLVAHTLGVRVVAGSNPAAPTKQKYNKSLNNLSRARQTISFGNRPI